jgi:hypothetical protein
MRRIVSAYTNNLAGPGNEGQVINVVDRETNAIIVRDFASQVFEASVCKELHDAPGKRRVNAGNRDDDVVLSDANLFATVVNESDQSHSSFHSLVMEHGNNASDPLTYRIE